MVLIYRDGDVSILDGVDVWIQIKKQEIIMIQRDFSDGCKELYLSGNEGDGLAKEVIYRFKVHCMVIPIWS